MRRWGVFDLQAPQPQARGLEKRHMDFRLGHGATVMVEPRVVIRPNTKPAWPQASKSGSRRRRRAIGRQLLRPEQPTGFPLAMTPAALLPAEAAFRSRPYAQHRCDCCSGAICIGECAPG